MSCISPLTPSQVDDSNLTHVKVGETMATFFGTTHEFHNIIVNTAAKVGIYNTVFVLPGANDDSLIVQT